MKYPFCDDLDIIIINKEHMTKFLPWIALGIGILSLTLSVIYFIQARNIDLNQSTPTVAGPEAGYCKLAEQTQEYAFVEKGRCASGQLGQAEWWCPQETTIRPDTETCEFYQ